MICGDFHISRLFSSSLTGSPRIHFKLIPKAKSETNCIVTSEKCKCENAARGCSMPMRESSWTKGPVKCLKTHPCAFNCLGSFLFASFDNHILMHLILQLLPKLHHFLLPTSISKLRDFIFFSFISFDFPPIVFLILAFASKDRSNLLGCR